MNDHSMMSTSFHNHRKIICFRNGLTKGIIVGHVNEIDFVKYLKISLRVQQLQKYILHPFAKTEKYVLRNFH